MKQIKNAIFFPAISIATHTSIMKNNWLVKGRTPRFYLNGMNETNQLFHHPYILTSAGHNYKNINFMKEIGINDKTKDVDMIFGDSGGFQIATGNIENTKENVEKLYAWMEANSTVSPIIDCPPWKSQGKAITDADLKEGARKTKTNVEILKNRKNANSVDWLNVLHGREYKQRMFWYNEVKDFNLQGWALGSLRKNAFNILTAFATLMDSREIDNADRCKLIHFFGFTSAKYIPYVIYLKHKLNKRGLNVNISFDSSYATQNGGWGKYLIYPSSTGFMSYHISNRLLGKVQDVPLPCSCPVCKDVKMLDMFNEKALKTEGDSYFYNIVQSHNVYMLNEYVKMLHSIIFTDSPELWATAFKSRQLNVFRIIDKMFDAAPGKAYNEIEPNEDILSKVDEEAEDTEAKEKAFDDLFGEEKEEVKDEEFAYER